MTEFFNDHLLRYTAPTGKVLHDHVKPLVLNNFSRFFYLALLLVSDLCFVIVSKIWDNAADSDYTGISRVKFRQPKKSITWKEFKETV